MAAQIQLANTFNEFRAAYNDAANDVTTLQTANSDIQSRVNSLENSNTAIFGGTAQLYANSLQLIDIDTGGRVLISRAAGTGSGAIIDADAGITYDTATNRLTVDGAINANGAITGANVTANNLTSGRVTFAGASGILSDDADLNYATANNTLISANGRFENNLYVADTITVGANVNATDTVNAAAHLHVGGVADWITAKEEDQDIHLITAVSESDGAHDIAIVNRSNSANAYAEFIAINNAGNTDNGWVSLGINATNYDQGAFAVTKGEDAYILYQAPEGTTKNGDLVIGTGGNGTTNRIIFSANGFDDPANNTQLTIDPGVRVHVEVPTQSTSTTTGALTVAGGLGVVGNMNVGGNVTITGTISLLGSGNTVSTDSLAVANAMLFLANGNASDSLDIGVVGQYQQGTAKYFGLVRDQSDGIFKLFLDATTKPANTVNFGQAGLNYGSVQIGELLTSNTTATSSTTTGSLRVAGGAGIAGGVWAGGAIRTDSTTPSTSVSSGALIVNGGAGIAGNVIAGAIQSTPIGSVTPSSGAFTSLAASGAVTVTSGTAATSHTTGAAVVTGGLGVSGAIFGNSTLRANGAVTFASTLDVTSTATFTGDVSIGGSLTANEIVEGVTDVAVSTNTYSVDYNNGNIFYATTAPASGDFTLALTNVPTTNGRVTNITLILPQGATARRPSANAISINGTSTLVNWVGGNTSFTPTASKTDIFNFTILRRSSAFTVAGTVTANTAL